MAKLTVSSLLGGFASIATMNANFQKIVTALENTLSRDGTTPNAMNADLDINSNRIINLAAPANPTDAARYQDVVDAAGGFAGSVAVADGSITDAKLSNSNSVLDAITTKLKFIASGTGAVYRSVRDKFRETVSVKDFGATGDGSTDDTAAIQAAITAACAVRGILYFPPCNAGQSYKITSGLTIPSSVVIKGAGPSGVLIYAVGLTLGTVIFDYNFTAISVSENFRLEGLTIRSDNGNPTGVRINNASYFLMKEVQFYGLKKGVLIAGTRAFSNTFENVRGYSMGSSTISFESFNGGGHYTFLGCAFTGDYGVKGDSSSLLNQMSFLSCNFEACGINSFRWEGSLWAPSFIGCRTEACLGNDFLFYPSAGNIISALVVKGCFFTANSGASLPVYMGGNGGTGPRGFSITGNHVSNGASTYFVTLNGDGEQGTISGNYFEQAATLPASSQRPGVVVHSNQNSVGQCPEWWGTSQWGVTEGTFTPVDASGDGLVLTLASGRYTKIGRMVHWQMYIRYPATGSATQAAIGGFPFTISLSTNQMGYGGANVNVSNVGSSVGILQGSPNTSAIGFYNPTAFTALPNSTFSGKDLLISGSFMV